MSFTNTKNSPNALWYAWQYTKAFAATPFNSNTRQNLKKIGGSTVLSVGALVATKTFAPYVAFTSFFIPLPIIPSLLVAAFWVGGIGSIAYFGATAISEAGTLKKSKTVTNYISQQKLKWISKKSQPKLTVRLRNGFKKLVAKSGAWLGYGIAGAGAVTAGLGALEYAGISVVPAVAMAEMAAALGMSAVTIPVLIAGAGAAVMSTGAVLSIVCLRNLRQLAPSVAPEKTLVRAQVSNHDNHTLTAQPVAPAFNTAAPETPAMSETQRKAAEARAARMKARTHG